MSRCDQGLSGSWNWLSQCRHLPVVLKQHAQVSMQSLAGATQQTTAEAAARDRAQYAHARLQRHAIHSSNAEHFVALQVAGLDNKVSKYGEDQQLAPHHTPFAERCVLGEVSLKGLAIECRRDQQQQEVCGRCKRGSASVSVCQKLVC